MKSNQKIKLRQMDDSNGYQKIVAGIVSLLLAIIIGVLVYWETQGSIDAFDETTETFTGYSHGDNASAETITLDNSPTGTGDTNVTCYSSTAGTLSYPSFTLSGKKVTITAGSASNYTQINVTYTSNMAEDEDETSSMANTVFGLMPIIALVVVAAVILGVVLGFGGDSGKRY